MLGATPAEAQSPVRQVSLLHSFNRGNMILDRFTGNFRVELDQRSEEPLNLIQVIVGPTGFVGAPETAMVDFIVSTFADNPKPDLIVTVAGPAALFASKYRQQLFPDTPLLFASVDERYLRDATLGENDTAVAVVNDFPGLVDDILQLLPETKQVLMVMGSGQIGKFWRQELETPFGRFRDRLDIYLVRRSHRFPSCCFALRTFPTTPPSSISTSAPTRRGRPMRTSESWPIFTRRRMPPCLRPTTCILAPVLSAAGCCPSTTRRTADAAVAILSGAPRAEVPPQLRDQPMFDSRELQRWGIPESRLPPGSVVINRAPSLWSEYKGTVLTAIGALAIQAFLIIGLLVESRARRRAEIDSRKT